MVHRWALLGIVLLAGGLVPAALLAQGGERCFAETGYCIDGRIREYWEQNGGLPVFGFPITAQMEEFIEGQPRQVQWFERNRMELHPENERPYDVLLGRLGGEHVAASGEPPRETPRDGCRYFEATGFNACGDILAYWQANGLELDGQPGKTGPESLALFGYPLTGEFATTLADGNQVTVQWFERARFELHPENQPPYNVLLGRLGVERLGEPQSPPPPVAAATPTPAPPSASCSSAYVGVCIPPPPPDLNCPEIRERYGCSIQVVEHPDPHGIDGDRDGIACECQ